MEMCSTHPVTDIRKQKNNPPRERHITTQEVNNIVQIMQYQLAHLILRFLIL